MLLFKSPTLESICNLGRYLLCWSNCKTLIGATRRLYIRAVERKCTAWPFWLQFITTGAQLHSLSIDIQVLLGKLSLMLAPNVPWQWLNVVWHRIFLYSALLFTRALGWLSQNLSNYSYWRQYGAPWNYTSLCMVLVHTTGLYTALTNIAYWRICLAQGIDAKLTLMSLTNYLLHLFPSTLGKLLYSMQRISCLFV